MSMQAVRVRSAIACEDLRQERDGKLFAIGIQNPVIGRPKSDTETASAPIVMHFVLAIDVPEAGKYELRFRLRPLGNKGGGSSSKIRVEFLEAADNVPFPLGPMRIRLDPDATGFVLEQAVEGNRWKKISSWRIADVDSDDDQ